MEQEMRDIIAQLPEALQPYLELEEARGLVWENNVTLTPVTRGVWETCTDGESDFWHWPEERHEMFCKIVESIYSSSDQAYYDMMELGGWTGVDI